MPVSELEKNAERIINKNKTANKTGIGIALKIALLLNRFFLEMNQMI